MKAQDHVHRTSARRTIRERGRWRRLAAAGATLVVALASSTVAPALRAASDAAGTRAMGLRQGPHGVGFELIKGADHTRPISRSGSGTRLGLALWYPAQPESAPRSRMSSMDYRLLQFLRVPTVAQQRALEDEEVESLVAWRHVGIVPLTVEQARASLHTSGVAVQRARAVKGRFPVVVVLGGPYYLSTTAELLASHGFLVMAPVRFSDQANDVGAREFTWYLENSVRDAEWALDELRSDPRADLQHVSALGHGGGGLQAMLLAMRNRTVKALVNIDAGNFSTRSQIRNLPFYSPRLMRAPYLFIATANTRQGLDLFDEFVQMKFSRRFEAILENPGIRHHDLSDIGRAVTAPMGIRGPAQGEVQLQYAAVQDMVVRFLTAYANTGEPRTDSFVDWISAQGAQGRVTIAVRPGVEPAPTAVEVSQSLTRDTAAQLEQARQRDPDAPVFQENALARLISEARAAGDLQTAVALGDLALGVHPTSAVLLAKAAGVAEDAGHAARAIEIARRCAALEVVDDWRASLAIAQCASRLARLTPSSPRLTR